MFEVFEDGEFGVKAGGLGGESCFSFDEAGMFDDAGGVLGFGDEERALVWFEKSSEDVEEGGLASAADADDAKYFAAANIKVNAAEDEIGAELFGEPVGAENDACFEVLEGFLDVFVNVLGGPAGFEEEFVQVIS